MAFSSVQAIKANYTNWKNKGDEWIENSISPKIPEWSDNVVNIVVLCDPVKRLLSDFLHVKAIHQKKNGTSGRYLGPDSELYPFR